MDQKELRQEVLKFLKEKTLAVLSTISPDNKPQSATIIYFIDDDFNFYFATRRNTRKFHNLGANGNVAIVVGSEPAPFTVQAEGVAESCGDEEFVKMMDARPGINKLYFGPFLDMKGLDLVTFKVRINWLRWLSVDQETGEEMYRQII